ncbi:MAG: ATP-binding protein [Bacteroidales bacterium]|jgi:hypothetical protein|nr:ATP-binding protein [Bacteroidales bacterium]
MKQDIIPDILNSRNERVILELPNYSYCHSQTQEENHSPFLGRQSLLRKLKNLLSTAVSKTGVYLVTGNRGVGKSRLVEEVIKETSLRKRSTVNSISFLFIVLSLTLGLQYVTNQDWHISICLWRAMFIVEILAAIILFFIIGRISYIRKITGQYEEPKKWRVNVSVWHTGSAIFKDFLILPSKTNPFLRTRNILKLVLLLLLFQILATLPAFLQTFDIIPFTHFPQTFDLTHFQLFIIYLFAILGYYYVKYAKQILIQEYRKSYNIKFKDWEDKNKKMSLAKAFKYKLRWVTFAVVIVSIATAVLSIKCSCWWLLLFLFIPVMVFTMHYYVMSLTLTENKKKKAFKYTWKYSYPQVTSLSDRIDHYIKNSSRVYLKINFGNDALNELDILRLITRTLTTEYGNFRKSWTHTLYWRALALVVLLSATHLFYKKIYRNDLLPLAEQSALYKHSSQLFYASDSVAKEDITLRKYIVYRNSLKTLPKEDNVKKKRIFIKEKMDTLKGAFFTQYPNIDDKKKYITPKYTLAIDKIINRTWFYLLNIPEYFWEKNKDEIKKIKDNYNHAPINYAWWLIFFTFYLFGCLLLRLPFFITHHTIKRQLKRLNENITYSVEREFNVNGGSEAGNIKTTIGVRKKKTRFIADAREIEKELQDILENIQRIPAFIARPEFVIIFDELDKVSSEIQTLTQENETKHKETLFASNSTSERQAVILKLLSNMKYFLSTAKAKFIFIAGREMYDMYLADIADRNNYFGSIFNDVIFVPSFLADVKNNNKQYDITTLVEQYVCRHLMPEDYPNIEYSLKEYNKYLDHIIYKDSKDEYKSQVKMKKQKIIATLQQFIIYLAHTSKGAPKKMVQVFESFIENYENEQLENRYLVVKQFKNTKLYLNFDYYAQYTIGMSSYLVTPVLNRLSSETNIQEHSDKLLVSTLHFIDYMMKFYSQNFSWRSIDISPEVIEINHSPELKAIVNDIVTLFEQIHFHKPVISLYEFKFDALLAQEIFFLSKMDERFSAQFNFSLDESLILKEYYKKLLKEKQAEYEKYKTYGENYVSSIASLLIVLGDLHFLDDELDVAALYYKDGLYLLQKQLDKDKYKENLEMFYLFIRNQLKLAYLYEKRKQPDFAYLLYGELTTLLIKYRDFDLVKFGISVRKEGDDFIMVKHKKNEKIEPYNKYIETSAYSQYKDIYIYEKDSTYSYITDNKEWGKNKDKAKIRSMKFEQLSPITQQIMFKNMTFEGLQLIYLPLLAKLQILEKRFVGILKKDIDLIEQEFEFLTRTINHSEVKILAADFYSKIGDILFYKNKVFSSSGEAGADNRKIDISHYACLYYKKAFIALAVKTGDEEEIIFKEKIILKILQEEDCKKAKYIGSKLSTRYRAMMARVLSNLGDTYFQAKGMKCDSCDFRNTDCSNIPFKIATAINVSYNDGFWKNWGRFINSKEGRYTLPDFINDIHEKDNDMKLSNIELALFCYSLSMKYYRNANQNKHYAFQVEKILNCLKYCLRHNIHTGEIKEFLNYNNKENLDALIRKAIRSLYIAYDNLNMLEINKRKEDFDKFNESYDERNIPLHYIQVDREVSRIRTIVKELDLELAKINHTEVKTVKNIYAQYITSPYHTNYSVSARVHRLRVKDRLNRDAFEIMKKEIFVRSSGNAVYPDYNNNFYCQILAILKSNQWWEDSKTKNIFDHLKVDKSGNKFFAVLEMLIADSIFCLDEILRLIKTAGDSYLFNHSFFATIYDRLAVWTLRYEVLQIIKDYCCSDNDVNETILPKRFRDTIGIVHFQKNDYSKQIFENMQIDNYLQKFLGNDFKEQLSSHYYREQALAHYYQTLDTHNGGRAYLNMLEQMYFINGDYDDVSSHFNVALERFLVNNSNIFQDRIKDLKDKGRHSTVYNVDNYFEKTDID